MYEGVITLAKYGRVLRELTTWSHHGELVNRLQAEAGDKESFTQKYLKRIRNKVSFHYDMNAVENVLSGFQFTQNTSFAESESKLDRDLAFVLADEVLVHYVISPIEERDTDEGKWDYFQEMLLEVSDDLVELLLRVTVELAHDFTKIEESTE